jgi:hypothetical protein
MITIAVCQVCGKQFPHDHPSRGQKYCSKICGGVAFRRSLADRFWEKVLKTDSCWLWRGAIGDSGYGHIADENRKTKIASRVSWELHYGSIPAGLHVLHRCDNPPCVRPDHLFLGTDADNAADMYAKGRQHKARGEAHPRAKLTEDQVRAIRQGRRTDAAFAREFGVTATAIYSVRRGQTWRHV